MKYTVALVFSLWLAVLPALHAADSPADHRALLAQAVITGDTEAQVELIRQLAGSTDELVGRGLAAWRLSELFLIETPGGAKVPFVLEAVLDSEGRARGIRLLDGAFLTGADGAELHFSPADLSPADAPPRVRRAIKATLDLSAIGHPQPRVRRDAVIKLGQERNPEYLPHFERRLAGETDGEVARALQEALALTRAASDDVEVRNAAIKRLGDMRSINSLSYLHELEKEILKAPGKHGPETPRILRTAILEIETYMWWGNLFGTLFRGFSLAAVLLVAALGLAITFGLMNIINMAHGEIMTIGAYTAFFVQGLFGKGVLFSLLGEPVSLPGMALTGHAFDSYFIVALAASFVTSALVGLLLERGIIRFLYKRPLESLLATWGVSLILQQIFRHTFGAANVQVDAPSFLSGSFVVSDVLFAYNRLFIIAFAVFIVFGTWQLLTRTSLGLQIRAVMQNRSMAACLGVRTDRVNMMTFAFGSGLAGMAGACLSQIANVGPSLGQNYIIDCFMVVVLGGVGNLVGTVSAATGVGLANQILEPWVGAVLGKIMVLVALILFLQWRPAGLFVTRSRSLDG